MFFSFIFVVYTIFGISHLFFIRTAVLVHIIHNKWIHTCKQCIWNVLRFFLSFSTQQKRHEKSIQMLVLFVFFVDFWTQNNRIAWFLYPFFLLGKCNYIVLLVENVIMHTECADCWVYCKFSTQGNLWSNINNDKQPTQSKKKCQQWFHCEYAVVFVLTM